MRGAAFSGLTARRTELHSAAMSDTDPPRLNGPQVLCLVCGAVCNHQTLLCVRQRQPDIICTRGGDGLIDADRAYLEWKRQRDAFSD